MQKTKPFGHLAVLDIETEPDPFALSLAPRGGKGERVALHRLTGFSILTATETQDLDWSGFELQTSSIADEYEMLFELDEALTAAQERGTTLVTYNGVAHDLPTIRRRRITHWLFSLPGLAGLENMAHRDLMRDRIRGIGAAWPSLRDVCSAWGIPTDHLLVHPAAEPRSISYRKSQVDVIATFLVLAHDLSAQRQESRTVSRAWLALSEYLRRPEVRQPHLTQFVNHVLVERARVEAGVNS